MVTGRFQYSQDLKINFERRVKPVFITILVLFQSMLIVSCTGKMNINSPAIKKVAILPFYPAGTDTAYFYAGNGLMLEVITKMAYLKSVTVRTYGTVKDHRLKRLELNELAYQLDIDYIIRGKFRATSDSLILDLEMIYIPGEKKHQEKHFEVDMTSLHTLPEIVASEILNEMGIETDQDENRKLFLDKSLDQNAYQLYLKAIATDPKTPKDWKYRIKLLEQSFEYDSTYAPSLAALGHACLEYSGKVGGKDGYYIRAEECLVRALELNEELPQAIYYLASLYAKIGKTKMSFELFSSGSMIYPGYQGFLSGLGYVNRYAGKMDQSVQAYRKSQVLDSSLANLVSSQMQILKSQIYSGNYLEAKQSYEDVCGYLNVMNKKPNEKQLFYGGVIHLYLNDTLKAAELFDLAYAVNPESVWTKFGQAYKAAITGNSENLADQIHSLESREIVDGERRYRMVHFCTMAGGYFEALDHLKASINAGFFNYPYIISDPLTARLREVDEFRAIANLAAKRHKSFSSKAEI